MKRKNVILELTLEFALEIISYCDLLEEKRKYVIAKQLLKSGTSIGANVNEAQSAESRKDFIHKMKIADKEVNETEYWLTLCDRSEKYPDVAELLKKIEDIKKILSKIISTTRNSI